MSEGDTSPGSRLRRLGAIWFVRSGEDAARDRLSALELAARVERESRALASIGLVARNYRVHDRLLVARDIEGRNQLPFDVAAAGADDVVEPGHRVGADVIRLGKVEDIVRVRAFYVGAGLSAVAHGSLPVPWPRPSVLHRGARVAALARRHGAFVVPRPIETGRGFRHAWLVEELVEGRHATRHEWPSVVPRVIDGMAEMWLASGLSSRPLRQVLTPRLTQTALQLLERDERLDIDRGLIGDAIRRLAEERRKVLVGWCHGDPMDANVLLTPDNRVALIDWEAAARRPVAWDLSKLVSEIPDARALVDRFDRRLASAVGGDTLAWRDQLVAICIVRFARSRLRLVRAGLSGNRAFEDHIHATRQRNLGLATRLLAG
jgi:hypothetical protein